VLVDGGSEWGGGDELARSGIEEGEEVNLIRDSVI